ncbi:Alpha/Beta hydrolase protein [Fomitopsis serialis]|uniref:Alpha/Beta hydrolase protein n=1 Tax=Fomitopsis serialis TaxID=139415 RepID=UPI002007CF28|nr:Alpha/Beta hydrolase protein [Neoantrodia serialis]KAH9929177.1 Alpha/Beta hydrolase protein [Neoantrodia serialis]
MERSQYKTVTTKRGLKYSYASIPAEGTPRDTLLFVHGFPSTSYDWRNQVDSFKKAGFALIVPDLLGTGETDKPTDAALFKFSAMAADVVDILDAENVGEVIVIGHDWGSVLASRLASYYPERFKAYAFFAVGYSPTSADFDYEAVLALIKQFIGYETYGYWQFFCEDGADKVIEDHLESFVSLLYPSDPAIWKTDMGPRGTAKAWLLSDKKTPLPSYLRDEVKILWYLPAICCSPLYQDVKHITDLIKKYGIRSSLNWYKSYIDGIAEEDKGIPAANQTITKPVLYGACQKDFVCTPGLFVPTMQKVCTNLTIKEYDTGHWVQLEATEKVNADLLEWIDGFTEKV